MVSADFKEQREILVNQMEELQAIKSRPVKEAFLKVERELFLPDDLKLSAYLDTALPLGPNQTMSQPTTIAIMLEMLDVKKGMKVLEVGSGSGYVLALLSELTGEEGRVFGIEIDPVFKERAEENLKMHGGLPSKNVKVFLGDGNEGLPDEKPFDRILISASSSFVPKSLIDQLKEGGIIVAPIGDMFFQELKKLSKVNGKIVEETYLESSFAFVPLIKKE